jgi:hypothetical protein
VDTFLCPNPPFALFFNFYYELPYRLFLPKIVKKKIKLVENEYVKCPEKKGEQQQQQP